MKILSNRYVCLIMLLCIVMAVFSCNYQGDIDTKATAKEAVKSLNKDTLLNIVNRLTMVMQKEPHGTSGGKRLLQAYAQSYKINIAGALNHRADSNEYLNVFIPEDGQLKPEMVAFRLHPPQSLRSQITVNDLIRSFGDYNASPPMEADTLSTSIFNLKAAPNVFIGVTSKKKLGENNNSVELITVMR